MIVRKSFIKKKKKAAERFGNRVLGRSAERMFRLLI